MPKQLMFDALTLYSDPWRKQGFSKPIDIRCRKVAAEKEKGNKSSITLQKFKVFYCSGEAIQTHLAPAPQIDLSSEVTLPASYSHWWEDDLELEDSPLVQYIRMIAATGPPLIQRFKATSGQVGSGGDRWFRTTTNEWIGWAVPRSLDSGELVQEQSDKTGARLWAVLQDGRQSVKMRAVALIELLGADTHAAESYLVDELCRYDVRSEWRNALILSAEVAPLENDDVRARLAPRLCELAHRLRQSPEANVKQVVHSAIRCYASLAGPEGATSLLTFLDPPVTVETRLVALQCIVHLFERRPPHEPLDALADRVYELGAKFLDRDWIVAGEKAALGQNATHALAALGDERLSECIGRVNQLSIPWLSRQVARKLTQTLSGWEAAGVSRDQPAAVERIRDAVTVLGK